LTNVHDLFSVVLVSDSGCGQQESSIFVLNIGFEKLEIGQKYIRKVAK